MELPREGRMFRRNVGARSTVSSCSSFAMEVKRKKIRESTLFLQNEVCLFFPIQGHSHYCSSDLASG